MARHAAVAALAGTSHHAHGLQTSGLSWGQHTTRTETQPAPVLALCAPEIRTACVLALRLPGCRRCLLSSVSGLILPIWATLALSAHGYYRPALPAALSVRLVGYLSCLHCPNQCGAARHICSLRSWSTPPLPPLAHCGGKSPATEKQLAVPVGTFSRPPRWRVLVRGWRKKPRHPRPKIPPSPGGGGVPSLVLCQSLLSPWPSCRIRTTAPPRLRRGTSFAGRAVQYKNIFSPHQFTFSAHLFY